VPAVGVAPRSLFTALLPRLWLPVSQGLALAQPSCTARAQDPERTMEMGGGAVRKHVAWRCAKHGK